MMNEIKLSRNAPDVANEVITDPGRGPSDSPGVEERSDATPGFRGNFWSGRRTWRINDAGTTNPARSAA